jgi:hypothetical protein
MKGFLNTGFEVLTAVEVKNFVFYEVTQRTPVKITEVSGETATSCIRTK